MRIFRRLHLVHQLDGRPGIRLAALSGMNIRIAPKIKISLCMVLACAGMLAFSQKASALTLNIGDSHELGYLWPGLPSGDQNRVIYVNHLIGMALNTIDIANGQIYFRSNNAFGSAPAATFALNGTGRNINLGAGGVYTYLFANYSGAGSEVWYIGNLTGVITLPAASGLFRLSNWTLLGPGAGAGVPDGGTTAMLLGMAICALVLSRQVIVNRSSRVVCKADR